jgi:hypothetical protein
MSRAVPSIPGTVPSTPANFGHVLSVPSVPSIHKRDQDTAAVRGQFRTGVRDARNGRNARNTEQTLGSLRHGGWNARHAEPSRFVAALGRPQPLVGLRAWRRRGALATDSESVASARQAGRFRRNSAELAAGSSPVCNADCHERLQTLHFAAVGPFNACRRRAHVPPRRGRPAVASRPSTHGGRVPSVRCHD